MNKLFHKLRLTALACLLGVVGPSCLTSCELVELGFDTETQQIVSMNFVHDTVYVMQGDTFFLAPYFYPETNISSTINMYSETDSIVGIQNDTIYAGCEGVTHIYAESVSSKATDTCTVVVMKPWMVDKYEYYRDQALYLDLSMGEHLAFDPSSMILAGFVGDDTCVGVAETIEGRDGKQCLFMRCWYHYWDEELNVRFRLYYKRTLQVAEIIQTVPFDGLVHGTPSSPLVLTLRKTAKDDNQENK